MNARKQEKTNFEKTSTFEFQNKQDCSYQGEALNVPTAS